MNPLNRRALAIAILAALQMREPGKRGATLDLAMLDCSVAVLENAIARCDLSGKAPEPLGTRHPSITPFQAFPTSDGAVVIAAGNESLWRRLCEVMEAPELIDDPLLTSNANRTENHAYMEQRVSERTRTRTTQEWLTLLEAARIPAGPIQTIADVLNDEHLQSRGIFLRMYGAGDEEFTAAGTPIRIDGRVPAIANRAPELGADEADVLQRWLPEPS